MKPVKYAVRLTKTLDPVFGKPYNRVEIATEADARTAHFEQAPFGVDFYQCAFGLGRRDVLAFGRRLIPRMPAEVLDRVRPGQTGICSEIEGGI